MYKKGKDGKIKGIENLEGLPDYIIYKTDKPRSMVYDGTHLTMFDSEKPEGFEGW